MDRTTGAARFPNTGYIDLPAGSAPATPASGQVRLYAKSDKSLYQKDDTGVEAGLADGGGTAAIANVIVVNGKIVESHASDAATFALKTLAGADPERGRPGTVIFPDATSRSITAALSVTLSSGSTAGFVTGVAGRLWFVLIDDSGTIRLGVRNCRASSGDNGFPAKGFYRVQQRVARAAPTAAGVTYTDSAVTAKPFVIMARAEYESGLTTAGTWDASPTRILLHGPGMSRPGDRVQCARLVDGAVAAGMTQFPYDNTIPQNTEGNQFMSQAITPTSRCNLFQVKVGFIGSNSTADALVFALFQDSTGDALAVAGALQAAAGNLILVTMNHVMWVNVAGGTATTFKVRGGPTGSATTTFNGGAGNPLFGGVLNSFIEIDEIMG